MTKWTRVAATMAALALPVAATAQSAAGVRAGARISQIETTHDAGSATDLVVGGYFGLGLTSNVALQFEAVYGPRGADALLLGDGAIAPDGSGVGVSMRYLEVPILLRAGFPGQRFLPSVFLGPYAAFLLDCEVHPSADSSRSCDAAGAAERFAPRATDYGVILGGALDMAVGNNTLFIDARYTRGLLSIEAGSDGMDARHGGLSISGGFAVPIGR